MKRASRSPQPTPTDAAPRRDLPAGAFSAWLGETRHALLTDSGSDVACGDCNACCSSSYFIHVKPEESRAISRIPKHLLVAAPGLAKDHVLMGYDKQGLCPMLSGGKCTIYAQRPQTCRNYDCRIFAAAGIAAGDTDKSRINARVQRWAFDYPNERDREEHLAVQAAATFIRERARSFPGGRTPGNPSELAILAIKVHAVFLRDGLANAAPRPPDADIAKAVIAAARQFDAGAPPR